VTRGAAPLTFPISPGSGGPHNFLISLLAHVVHFLHETDEPARFGRAATPRIIREESPVPEPRILVVEDETNVRELEAEILREEWEHVDTAVDGTDALRLLAEHVYAAIVSDLAMPKLDGRGLYQEVERRWPAAHGRLVFVTGYAEAEEYDEFLRQSGVPVLAKPFTIADLLGAVQRAFSPA
jgi:CheY-like chemotaxis protein